jgi:hypothetical protein
VGANDPTFCFSVGVNEFGDCGALLPVGASVSAGFSPVSLPHAVMVAMPTTAVAPANRANLDVRRVFFTFLFPLPWSPSQGFRR